jgi:hypothetical protein
MSKNSQLYQLMITDLPPRTFQKRLRYRTNQREVLALFKVINKEIFNDKLPTPKIEVQSNCRKYWGICEANGLYPKYQSYKSNCTIRLSDKWYCKQWLITTLAHEMCHQYQWDVESHKRIKEGKKPLMSHGPSFFIWREKLHKHGIPLKTAHRMRHWFKHQSMFKC